MSYVGDIDPPILLSQLFYAINLLGIVHKWKAFAQHFFSRVQMPYQCCIEAGWKFAVEEGWEETVQGKDPDLTPHVTVAIK